MSLYVWFMTFPLLTADHYQVMVLTGYTILCVTHNLTDGIYKVMGQLDMQHYASQTTTVTLPVNPIT